MALARRTPLRRGGRLSRKTALKAKRERPRRGPRRDRAYMDRVKELPCCAPGAPAGCWGSIDPSHTGERGLGQKADDWTCIPKCRGHHEAWECHHGVFAGWSKERRREWAAAEVVRVQALYLARLAR